MPEVADLSTAFDAALVDCNIQASHEAGIADAVDNGSNLVTFSSYSYYDDMSVFDVECAALGKLKAAGAV